jgi:hypothetical protein
MVANDSECFLDQRGALVNIASKLAPAGGSIIQLSKM